MREALATPVPRAFYQRLLERGKPKKVALTACMHKLLTILHAVLRARPLAAATPLAARALAPQRIARWRLTAVVAILGQPSLQLLDPSQQLLHLCPQGVVVRPQCDSLHDLRAQRGILRFQRGDVVVSCAHAPLLHPHRKSVREVPFSGSIIYCSSEEPHATGQ